MNRALVVGALVALAASGCTKAASSPEQTGTLTPVQLPTDHPVVTPLPDPELNGGHAGRAPRRITVAQLKTSIVTVTGKQWSQIDNLASSLGQADYALTVSDATEPNLVFAKFLDDGAREVCLAAARDDLNKMQDQRVLWPEVPGTSRDFTTLDDATIQQNLKTLSVRFWGSPFEADELTAWTGTFKKVAARAKAANKPEQAWGSICVALMTDPRFITY
ncbi:MAG: hypothetical protein U0228_00420 [Myxococcaceae bacterium]